MKKQDLNPEEFDSYYLRYINKLDKKTELIQGFVDGKTNLIDFFKSIPNGKLLSRYQPKKWTIKEIFQHLIDTERIFMNRCFRIARRDTTPISGYDQEIYAIPSRANEKTIDDLLNEFIINRNNSIALLQSLTKEDLCFIGNANGGKLSARAAAFIIIGHDIWHKHTIEDKYL